MTDGWWLMSDFGQFQSVRFQISFEFISLKIEISFEICFAYLPNGYIKLLEYRIFKQVISTNMFYF